MTNFAEILKGLMKERNMIQVELADALGVRQSQVSNWVASKSLPGYKSLKRLSEFFGISADKLLAGEV